MGDRVAAVAEGVTDQKLNPQVAEDRRTPDKFWPGVMVGVVVTLLLALIAMPVSQLFFNNLPESDVTLPRSQVVTIREGPLAGSAVVRYVGTISKPGVALIQKELEKLSNERPVWLSMESGGGDVEAANSLSDYINGAKIGLAIPEKAQCASACTLMYAAAERKYASSNAYFGFHYAVKSRDLFNFGLSVVRYDSYVP